MVDHVQLPPANTTLRIYTYSYQRRRFSIEFITFAINIPRVFRRELYFSLKRISFVRITRIKDGSRELRISMRLTDSPPWVFIGTIFTTLGSRKNGGPISLSQIRTPDASVVVVAVAGYRRKRKRERRRGERARGAIWPGSRRGRRAPALTSHLTLASRLFYLIRDLCGCERGCDRKAFPS